MNGTIAKIGPAAVTEEVAKPKRQRAVKAKDDKAVVDKTTVAKPTRKASTKQVVAAQTAAQRNYAAMGVASIATALTAISLTHLSAGIHELTNCDQWEAWAMAIGIDANFIATEVALLAVDDETRKRISVAASCTKAITLVGSAALNAFGWARHASPEYMWYAAAAGVVIPALIYLATYKLGHMKLH